MGTQLFPIKLSIKEIYRSVDGCQLPHQIVLEHVVIFFNQKYVICAIKYPLYYCSYKTNLKMFL